MSAEQFSVKSVVCDISKTNSVIQDMEHRWLQSLLTRLNVPKLMLSKRLAGDLSNPQWRDYLFGTYGINIYRNLETKEITVFKYSEATEDNIKVAEWSMPEIIRVKEKDGKSHCKLSLKYWQII